MRTKKQLQKRMIELIKEKQPLQSFALYSDVIRYKRIIEISQGVKPLQLFKY